MVAQEHGFGKTESHHVGVIIPMVSEDAQRWVEFAGRKLAERFGEAYATAGMAGWTRDGISETTPVVVVHAYPPVLRELDMAILYGIGLQVYEGTGHPGVAVMVDDDLFMF